MDLSSSQMHLLSSKSNILFLPFLVANHGESALKGTSIHVNPDFKGSEELASRKALEPLNVLRWSLKLAEG